MILITGDVSEISSVMSNLDTGNAFEQIGLTDGTSMLAVLELATAENEGSDDEAGGYLDMITYNAQVKNGRYQSRVGFIQLCRLQCGRDRDRPCHAPGLLQWKPARTESSAV